MRAALTTLAALLALLAPAARAATLAGTVSAVSDGDTLRVRLSTGPTETVRLIGVDAPELGQAPWGDRARAALLRLAPVGSALRLETDVQARDRYGRLLAYAYRGQTFLNLELMRQGHAVLLTVPPNVARVEALRAAQARARAEGLGVWDPRAPLPVSPQDYRAGRSSPAPSPAPARAPSPPARPAGSRLDPRGPDRDCGDFLDRAEAQAFFEAAGPGDPHDLDRDNDGDACEALR